MVLSNYHTHCCFCDGKGNPEDYIKEALKLGFFTLGFSSHSPVHFENGWSMPQENLPKYIKRIQQLKESYKDKLQVYLGMELDYFDTVKLQLPALDYFIGSVHYMFNYKSGHYLNVDGSKESYQTLVNELFNGDTRAFVEHYYSLVSSMVKLYKPNIVGHLDLIKKNNKNNAYFNENDGWYKDAVFETLKTIKSYGGIIEVNTGGISRGYINDFYPSDFILKECLKLDIPITISADAHDPLKLNSCFDKAYDRLKNIGYQEQAILIDNKWKFVQL